MQTVVAGLIWRSGKLLIGQRLGSGTHPLLWEFPGGKVEPGETEQHALIRELKEELAIDAMPGPEFSRYQFSYSGKSPILLIFTTIESFTGNLQNTGAFEAIAWERPQNFAAYDFLAGDLPLIQLLGKVHIDKVE